MSAVKSVNLCCDDSDCQRWGSQFGGGVYATALGVRDYAKRYGWTHVNGKDYCPDCSKKQEAYRHAAIDSAIAAGNGEGV